MGRLEKLKSEDYWIEVFKLTTEQGWGNEEAARLVVERIDEVAKMKHNPVQIDAILNVCLNKALCSPTPCKRDSNSIADFVYQFLKDENIL